ncbi:MAG: ABC transporter ATP-binding protein, partial [Candidatus Hodarchaeales archaeon]
TKYFEDVVAVSRLNMHVKEGSVTGFLGPNGAGKSTTLKLIMGELKANNGTVRVMGENPWNNLELRMHLGYVSEYDDFYPWMSAKRFVTTMAAFYMPLEEAKRASLEALKLVGLENRSNRPIKSYSKGMKQRVKVAAAIVHSPDILIMDEPFGGLDPLRRREMKRLISDLHENHGVTVLISSHILYEIDEMSSHMVLIHRGQNVAEGRPKDIVELIDRYPHRILFRGIPEELTRLTKLLLDEKIIKSVTVSESEKNRSQLHITTEKSKEFYGTVTRVIAENNIKIEHLESLTDNVESIFEYLTTT